MRTGWLAARCSLLAARCSLLALICSLSATASGGPDDAVVICHFPPRDPAKPVTISVPTASLPAHFAHGDYAGPCDAIEAGDPAVASGGGDDIEPTKFGPKLPPGPGLFKPDPCLHDQAYDAIYKVPVKFFGAESTSNGAKYFYKTAFSGSPKCDAWILDVYVWDYSNAPLYPQEPGHGVIIKGDFWDLPSSKSFGGVLPVIEEDCKRYSLQIRHNVKFDNQGLFSLTIGGPITLVGGPITFAGIWDGKQCFQEQIAGNLTAAGVFAKKSATGNLNLPDIHRYMVAGSLRDVGQRVRITLLEPPPK